MLRVRPEALRIAKLLVHADFIDPCAFDRAQCHKVRAKEKLTEFDLRATYLQPARRSRIEGKG